MKLPAVQYVVPKCSSQCSQESAAGLYLIQMNPFNATSPTFYKMPLILVTRLRQRLPSDTHLVFPDDNFVCIFIIAMRALCPAYVAFLGLIPGIKCR